MKIKPKRDPLEEEKQWWDKGGAQNEKNKPFPAKHHLPTAPSAQDCMIPC